MIFRKREMDRLFESALRLRGFSLSFIKVQKYYVCNLLLLLFFFFSFLFFFTFLFYLFERNFVRFFSFAKYIVFDCFLLFFSKIKKKKKSDYYICWKTGTTGQLESEAPRYAGVPTCLTFIIAWVTHGVRKFIFILL